MSVVPHALTPRNAAFLLIPSLLWAGNTVFTATLSALVLGDMPQLYHAAAFVLIIGGIVMSSRK
jgi:drug/metabolite transporter (DMT)-like permease